MSRVFGRNGRRFLALLPLSLLICSSCELGNSDGGPGPGPGVSGSVSTAPGIPSMLRASAKGIQPEPNSGSFDPSVSFDGRYVAFYSDASNLVAGDTNFTTDVFVRDRDADGNSIFDESGGVATIRVNVATDGTEANNYSYNASISDDGRFVAFISYADNLDQVTPDTNGNSDVFVHDRDVDGPGGAAMDEPGNIATTRVSVDSNGVEADQFSDVSDISGDGRYVVFVSYATNLDPLGPAFDTNGTYDVFIHNRDVSGNGVYDEAGDISTVRIRAFDGAEPSDFSYYPYFSGDGRFVSFYSYSSNLVPGDNNFTQDIFVHDRDPNNDGMDGPDTNIVRVSVATDGTEADNYCSLWGRNISDDGRFVVFYSGASTLVPGWNGVQNIYLRDRDVDGPGGLPMDDPANVATLRVGVDSGGAQANSQCYFPSISGDGQRIAFMSLGSNLVPGDTNGTYDIFVRDLSGPTTERVSVSSSGFQGNQFSYPVNISRDGSTVVFRSYSSNLVPVDTNGTYDCFARDIAAKRTVRVSEGASTEPGGHSFNATISGDGSFIAYESDANDIVAGDVNFVRDIFLRDMTTGANVRVSINTAGAAANAASSNAVISSDGRFVAFQSTATNLDPDDADATSDVFVRGLSATTLVSRAGPGAGVKGNAFSGNSSISATGQFIAFESTATNLHAADADATLDIFVRDIVNNTTTLVSRASGAGGVKGNGASGNPSISGNGQFVIFESTATNLDGGDANGAVSDIYVRDLFNFTTTRVNLDSFGAQASGGLSRNASISDDGQIVVFESFATNLAGFATTLGRSHIYLRDLNSGQTTLVSMTPGAGGTEADANSASPVISADGAFVAYHSLATDIVANDVNTQADVFRYEVATGINDRISSNTSGIDSVPPVSGPSFLPAISSDGLFVAFESLARDLVSPPELGSFLDIYRRGP